MTDLDRLDALAAAATPGPWVQSMFVDGREYEHMSKQWKDARQAEEVRMVRSGSAKGQHVALAQDPWNAEADAAFIAACDPATIRDLVAAARERDETDRHPNMWSSADLLDIYDRTADRPDIRDKIRHLIDPAALHHDAARAAAPSVEPMVALPPADPRLIGTEYRPLVSSPAPVVPGTFSPEPAAPPAPDRAAEREIEEKP